MAISEYQDWTLGDAEENGQTFRAYQTEKFGHKIIVDKQLVDWLLPWEREPFLRHEIVQALANRK